MGKPQGGPHREERKKLLAEHARIYKKYQQGEVEEADLDANVRELRDKGIPFVEIVEARKRLLRRNLKDEEGERPVAERIG